MNNLLNYNCFLVSPILFFSLSNLVPIFFIIICFIWDNFLDFSYNLILLGFFLSNWSLFFLLLSFCFSNFRLIFFFMFPSFKNKLIRSWTSWLKPGPRFHGLQVLETRSSLGGSRRVCFIFFSFLKLMFSYVWTFFLDFCFVIFYGLLSI